MTGSGPRTLITLQTSRSALRVENRPSGYRESAKLGITIFEGASMTGSGPRSAHYTANFSCGGLKRVSCSSGGLKSVLISLLHDFQPSFFSCRRPRARHLGTQAMSAHRSRSQLNLASVIANRMKRECPHWRTTTRGCQRCLTVQATANVR